MVSESSEPTRSVRTSRSTVTTCDTLATESFGSPVCRDGANTFPGASRSRKLEVSTTAMTVWMRLLLKSSLWMTTSGRRKPGDDPRGSSRSAHQTSPRRITVSMSRASPAAARPAAAPRAGCLQRDTRRRAAPSPSTLDACRCTRQAPQRRVHSATSPAAVPMSPRTQRGHQEGRWLSSYHQYTLVIPQAPGTRLKVHCNPLSRLAASACQTFLRN
jgi:hypothetical protein